MIGIINYGLGNIQALVNLYQQLNIPVKVIDTPEALSCAQKLILPGVGAFDWALQRLHASGFLPYLDEYVIEKKMPILGICVGMQIMAERSEEGRLPGLGWFQATVKRFESGKNNLPLPHMGWNDVYPDSDNTLFQKFDTEPQFYFLHTYHFCLKTQEKELASSDYGGRFSCAIRSENIFGVQFHPEKSHHWGSLLLKNFAELPTC